MSGFRRSSGERPDRHGREARIDPVCHTLAGAALARTGLGRPTALGATALILGANLPDIDVLAYFGGNEAGLEWRRGWTHGILALAVLPLVLTGGLLGLHRASAWVRRMAGDRVDAPQLLRLSFIAIFSHPVLDTLNTYGMRWLMPFSGRWFYGDTLFIVDPWVWLALALGIYTSRERQRLGRPYPGRPARVALALVLAYIAGMAVSGWAAGGIIEREVASISGKQVQRVMPGPAPLNPLVRHFVAEQEQQYQVGTFRWLDTRPVSQDQLLAYPRSRPSHPAIGVALSTEPARSFMGWARFPTFEVQETGPGEYMVHIVDLRYARGPDDGFGALSIPVTLGSASGPSPGSRRPSFEGAPASPGP